MTNRLEEEFFNRNQKGLKKICYKARALLGRVFVLSNLFLLIGCFLGSAIPLVVSRGLDRIEVERKIKAYTDFTNPMIFQGSSLVVIGEKGFRCSEIRKEEDVSFKGFNKSIYLTLVDGREMSFKDTSYVIYPMKDKSYLFWRNQEKSLRLTSIEGEFGPRMYWNSANKE